MTKKKIGIIIYSNPDYYPPTVNAIHLLADHFDVILIGRNHELPHWQYPPNVTVHRLGKYTSVREREQASAISKLWEYITFVKRAHFLLKDVSLIYAYDAFAYTVAYISRSVFSRFIPLIYHMHELPDQLISLTSLSGWVLRAERKWIHQADAVVLPSEARSLFIKNSLNLKQQPFIIPNFPRKSFLKLIEISENTLWKRFEEPQVLLQGAISKNNSMIDLIESLVFISNAIQLKFIGPIDQDELDFMSKLAADKNVIDRVKYFKPVPYTELFTHTYQASVGVCLYKRININLEFMVTASNKIYEYAACGLPVIVSDFPNCREFLGNETWVRFANPDSPRSIASAVEDIMSDLENYKQMCLAARSAFENKFNYEKVFSPLLTKIKDLIGVSS